MEKNPTMLVVVAAALVGGDGRILLQKRPENKMMAGLWEFPGGKVEPGESLAAALARELNEELDIKVSVGDMIPLTFAAEPLEGRDLLLLLYICGSWEGEPRGVESSELAWVTPQEMRALPMPPADAPFIPILEDYLART